ncbi:hypothetical protein L1987_04051 [Smallanthus sonchifolius]|uniref:Uncharacterized protein n=1 Tax=Smallanthus sonchifolius TaxID=185202 RepID=A0ACB9KCD3_9ASTR|nr:hypothetical protein L1987_04051 [Smallanthus sonchifolius]
MLKGVNLIFRLLCRFLGVVSKAGPVVQPSIGRGVMCSKINTPQAYCAQRSAGVMCPKINSHQRIVPKDK